MPTTLGMAPRVALPALAIHLRSVLIQADVAFPLEIL